MLQFLNYAGNAAGVFGVLLCAISGINRLMGNYYVGGVEASTLFMVGTGLMVFACLVKLETLVRKND